MAEPTKAVLQEQLTEVKAAMEELRTVDGVIECINLLTDEQKRELTFKVRTTPEGIRAYTAVLYGATNAEQEGGIIIKELPKEA